MGFRIASEKKKLFRIASDLGVCDSNRIAHRGCIARFGPLRCKCRWVNLVLQTCATPRLLLERGEKTPTPQDLSLTKKTARFTKGQFRPY